MSAARTGSDWIGLGLMCKPPRPGTSKTRLARTIGADAAARLSRAFLEDCARSAAEAAAIARLKPRAFFRPEDGRQELADILGPAWPLTFADAGDLGATMIEGLAQLLEECPAGAMIMGADLPLMGKAVIAEAAEALRASDPDGVVIVPSADGGYCLLGVRSLAAARALCAPMAWSTPTVLAETCRRADSADLVVQSLAEQRDIDEQADLDWLKAELARDEAAAPATRRAVTALEARAP
ncbi:MAG: TIGR04282 family arsenosugar biosynthesis glycosyltransferase [Beijerinckiaceae bacterium]|nr:TIGR04282 family arsenosugar biosynthesis glycosyltransferase [Beijerinckiaceae bacterium]